jgi:23S rRNA pseudouridine1911/1915/1917 synthase
MSFETPLPDDMELCIEKWRNYVKHQKDFES